MNVKNYLRSFAVFILLVLPTALLFIFHLTGTRALTCIPPIVFSILYVGILKIDKYKNHSIAFCLMLITGIRFYIYPILTILDSDYLSTSPIKGYGAINGVYFKDGVTLLSWESFFLGLVLLFLFKKWYNADSYNHKYVSNYYIAKDDIVIIFLVLFLLLGLVFPSAFSKWHFILNLENTSDANARNSQSSFNSLLSIAIWNFYLLLPIPFICEIVKSNLDGKTKYYICIFVFILSYGLFINDTSRASIIFPLLASLFIINRLFPDHSKQSLSYFGGFIMTVLIITTIWKTYSQGGRVASANPLNELTQMLEIYFQGFSNVGKAVLAYRASGISFSPTCLFNDLFQNVPIINKFTNFNNSSIYWFLSIWKRTDQVIPAAGNGMFYVGYLCSPIVTVFQLVVAREFEKRSETTNNIASLVAFTYITVMITYGCFSSISIFMQKLTNTVFVVLIISIINQKVRLTRG